MKKKAVFLVSMLCLFLLGIEADSMGKRKVLLSSGLLFSLGCFMTAGASGYGAALLGVFVIGTGYSVCESGAVFFQSGGRSKPPAHGLLEPYVSAGPGMHCFTSAAGLTCC